jgi:hypothetical protein
VKIVEQQLLHSLRETPFETDCSISVAVLASLQLATAEQQRVWLHRHREPRDGKQWHCIGGRWVYTARPEVEEPRKPDAPLFPRPHQQKQKSAKSVPAPTPPRVARMVVKPVVPLHSADSTLSSR